MTDAWVAGRPLELHDFHLEDLLYLDASTWGAAGQGSEWGAGGFCLCSEATARMPGILGMSLACSVGGLWVLSGSCGWALARFGHVRLGLGSLSL